MNTELGDQAAPCSNQRRRTQQASDGSANARIVAALYSRVRLHRSRFGSQPSIVCRRLRSGGSVGAFYGSLSVDAAD